VPLVDDQELLTQYRNIIGCSLNALYIKTEYSMYCWFLAPISAPTPLNVGIVTPMVGTPTSSSGPFEAAENFKNAAVE